VLLLGHTEPSGESRDALGSTALAVEGGSLMSRHYALKTFLRQMPCASVNHLIRRHTKDCELVDGPRKAAHVDTMCAHLTSLPPEALASIERDFEDVHALACEKGVEALLKVAIDSGVELKHIFSLGVNDYERSAFAFLHHAEVFESALWAHEIDGAALGSWRRRFVGAGFDVSGAPEQCELLARFIRQSLRRQGRGTHCAVQCYLRQNPTRHCFFAYPENRAASDLAFDDEELIDFKWRPAMEVIFVYRPDDGVVEIRCEGGRRQADEYAENFCTSVLGLPELPPYQPPFHYDLQGLLHPMFDLPIVPNSGVREARLCSVELTLNAARGWRRKLTLDSEPKNLQPASLNAIIHESLRKDSVPFTSITVASAKFRLTFEPEFRKRAKTLTFRVSPPDGCSLRDYANDQIARKHLSYWGILATGSAAGSATRPRAA
jgi:hypothetical protein